MKLKSTITSLLITAWAFNAHAASANGNTKAEDKTFEITVNLPEPVNGTFYLTCVKDRFTKLDSVKVDGTSFTFRGEIDRVDQYRIIAPRYRYEANVCVEPGCHYQVNITGKRDYQVATTDGEEQLVMNRFTDIITPFENGTETLAIRYSKLKDEGNDTEADQLMKELRARWDKSAETKLELIRQNPKTFAAMVTAGNLLANDYPTLRSVYELVDSAKYGHTYSWRSFKKKYSEAEAKWIQDRPAPKFVTKDIAGNTVTLDDFKGKFLLLDFWASWCKPCRAKMKELKEIYPRLLEKGIVVCSISLDEDRAQWEKASKEDGVEWVNTCDLKPFDDNVISAAYNVTNVPTLFVVDPNGIIIKQNPTIEEILALEL